ncbi:tautomerase family protein [Bradyrhizobium sp. AS23.2]|uniref:tautomerase family protein n=1 Tax=Bradyrhizobium sp. AS23.2 TaxID=1680155 RepID=UPI00093FDA09|nr:tautomerase family protein [Bradyrhizobium sp. AS23.2]OKO71485.1 4-oxalocrotonate tautomerase [Bradyrhizobium sp. AS23.2]
MPHVIVKLYSGRSDEQKKLLANEITKTIMATLGSKEDAISVGIEDVEPTEWSERVHKPDVLGKPETIYKRPGG